MQLERIKNSVVLTVCCLYVLLFVYAAVSKLLDFENFQVQLGQSPLLGAFAGYLAWGIPAIELIIAAVLSWSRFRKGGLLCAFGLMVMFSIYIHLILNYSSYVPCSCGGILEKMNWTEHFYFNIGFCLLALLALSLLIEDRVYLVTRVVAVFTFSVVLMVGLFLESEEIIYKRNNFVRRFPPFPAKREQVVELDANSYYFAGKSDSALYFGNTTAPALITELGTSSGKRTTYHFQISDTLFKFLNVKLVVDPPYFFVYDGKVPCIFKGRLDQLQAILQTEKIPGFTKAKVVDSTTLIMRTLNQSRENVLATLDIANGKVQTAPQLLEKQIDGLFDTDGILNYSPSLERFVYVYYYRNQYVIADRRLNLIDRGNTIDTTTQAAIKIEYVRSKNERKFSAPPLLVNRLSTIHHNLLFVNSTLPSRYEEKRMWSNAHVIDVYDVLSKSYAMSFYVYKVDGDKIDDILVTDTHLFAIVGSKLVSYRFSPELVNQFKRK